MKNIFEDLYYSSYEGNKKLDKKLSKKKYNHNPYSGSEINPDFFNSVIDKELKKKENKNIFFPEKTRELLKQMSFYDYCNRKSMIKKYFENLNNDEKNLFLDIIYYFYDIQGTQHLIYILQSNFNIMPYSTKKYREFCKKKVNNNLNQKGNILYDNNKKQSIIYEIVTDVDEYSYCYLNNNKQNKIISLCFDYLTTLDKIFLYNLSKGNIDEINYENNNELLDQKYLKYIEGKNMRQKICLICIIDRYKYSELINNITYPYINELHFTLFSNLSFNENFMFSDLPIKDLYSIFITYFLTIKNYQNIEKISFGNEFFLNKNQFLSYNDDYYQSIISYLIDQYLINFINTGKNVLDKVGIKNVDLMEDKLNNVYEKYKIIYGFNKMFPNLENKKILEISYEDIMNNKYEIINDIKCNYKIIEVNFDNKELKKDINSIINDVKNFIKQNLYNHINDILIISFINFTTENNNNENINLNNFEEIKNLEEFFINNNNRNKIVNINNLKFSQFKYLYLGYDLNDNLIYYRNGKNPIKSIDLLDLFNLFNNKISKIHFDYENIDIIFNKEKSQLKIINLNKNHNDYKINILSDFIKNINNLNDLIIEGLDFTFEEIQNINIKNLSINYDTNCKELFNYNINAFNKAYYLIQKDANIKQKFPNLEIMSIGNIKNENILFEQLFITSNFSSTLKEINIITYHKYKFNKINNNIKTNIISNKIESINKKEKEEENSYDYEDEEDEYDNYDDEDDFFNDKYNDLLKNENPILIDGVPNKKRKINNINIVNEEDVEKFALIREKIDPYKKIEENIFKKDIRAYLKNENILYFNSKIIKTVNQFYLIQHSLSLIEHNIDINKIIFKQLPIPKNYKDSQDIYKNYKNIQNLFIVFETDSTDIICIFNKDPTEYGDNFCLFMNKNEVHFHIKEENKKLKNNQSEIQEIKRNKRNNYWRNKIKKKNLITEFFEAKNFDEYTYNSEAFLEIYQINFNN